MKDGVTRQLLRCGFVSIVGVCVASCSDDSRRPSTPTAPTVTLGDVSISGMSPTLGLGSAPVQLTAIATFSDGSKQDVTSRAAWAAAPDGVVSISASGVLEARAEGEATVSATYQQIAGSSRIRVTARPITLRGLVVEAYGDAPVPDATVAIVDGPDAGRVARTDNAGGFVFTDVSASTVRVTATAKDFELDHGIVGSGSEAIIRLEPLSVEVRWDGQLTGAGQQPPDNQPAETTVIEVRHRGPMKVVAHQDCQAGGSEYGPIRIGITRPPETRFLMQVWTTAYGSHGEASEIVPPGRYEIYKRLYDTFPLPAGGCRWYAFVEYPR